MIKLKNILNEQDNTISAKEWRKVSRAITRGMDVALGKGVKYLRDYERSNLPAKEKKMLSDFWDDYMILKNRFQRINNHLISKKHLKEKHFRTSDAGTLDILIKKHERFSIDAVNKACKRNRKSSETEQMYFHIRYEKQGKYDKFDLVRSIKDGNIKDSSFSKRGVLKTIVL